ncbi:MAG: hypothetical protein ACD_82C00019G0001 [uncultured bacterium]|nr:MAG: hypothetical protein ACD_82C00019G0001 [uncultured bacterium]
MQDSIKSFSPLTFKNVSCCPAKDAPGKSSAVAEDLTATEKLFLLSHSYNLHNCKYASSISLCSSCGISPFFIKSLIS